MTRFIDREEARKFRAQGKSYSEIKKLIGVSKSTLSGWLQDMPLSNEQVRQLRDLNPRRIESYRNTMRKKREARMEIAYQKASKDIGALTKRELFIAGLYLYWGEGTKSDKGAITFTNTDPVMIRMCMDWMQAMGIPKESLVVRLHLYADMDQESEVAFWSKLIELSPTQFRKPYIKQSSLSGLTYKTGYAHGTCNIRFENMAMWEYITMALRYMREQYFRP